MFSGFLSDYKTVRVRFTFLPTCALGLTGNQSLSQLGSTPDHDSNENKRHRECIDG